MKIAQHGFTLLELMTALAVLAVLAAIATPSFMQFAANSRTAAIANTVASALAVARSEALRQSSPVAICPSKNGKQCDSANWGDGWIVFTDASNPGVVNGGDVVIQTWPAPTGGVTVNLVGPNNYIRFDARGMLTPAIAATFTVSAPHCSGNNISQIAVTASGSPQSTKLACP